MMELIELLRKVLMGVGIYLAVGGVLAIIVFVVVLAFFIQSWRSMR